MFFGKRLKIRAWIINRDSVKQVDNFKYLRVRMLKLTGTRNAHHEHVAVVSQKLARAILNSFNLEEGNMYLLLSNYIRPKPRPSPIWNDIRPAIILVCLFGKSPILLSSQLCIQYKFAHGM